MSHLPSIVSRRQMLWLSGGLAGGLALHGCTRSADSSAASPSPLPPVGQPLKSGLAPWPGFASHFVAIKKGFFQQEGVNVQETFFPTASDNITGFLAGKVDVTWTTSGDAIEMINKDPSIRIIYLVDYSNGSDGIMGRGINSPQDLKGKTIGRENLLFENVLLRAYLAQGGLTEADVTIKDMTAADAATAFAAKRIDAAVSYEPWLSKAAQQGGGKVIFSTKDTNLIADVIATRQPIIETRKADLQAYLRAVDKAVKLVNAADPEAIQITATKLGVSVDEAKVQLSGVKIFDLAENKSLGFNPSNSQSVLKNLELNVKAAHDSKLIPKLLETKALYDDSIVKSL
jgi:NitT/TauT family transport system substrate-binding protein